MSDVMEEYPHLNDLTQGQLLSRRQDLTAADPTGASLSDDTLRELVAIARILRKRTSAPTTKSKSTKITPSLDAL